MKTYFGFDSYPEATDEILNYFFKTVCDVMRYSYSRKKNPISLLMSYCPRVENTTERFYAAALRAGLEFKQVPFQNYIDKAPLLGSYILILELKEDLHI